MTESSKLELQIGFDKLKKYLTNNKVHPSIYRLVPVATTPAHLCITFTGAREAHSGEFLLLKSFSLDNEEWQFYEDSDKLGEKTLYYYMFRLDELPF